MNENNANLCEMEQEIFQIKDTPRGSIHIENRAIFICNRLQSHRR